MQLRSQATKRALVIGLEFVEPLFSGNGILTHSVVRGLLSQDFEVLVLCAYPYEDKIPKIHYSFEEAARNGKLRFVTVSVPSSKWKRLDRDSAWMEMAMNAPEVLLKSGTELYGRYQYIIGIDWSAVATYHSLLKNRMVSKNCHYINMVFRVFSESKQLIKSKEDAHFYNNCEILAMKEAKVNFALSHVDEKCLQNILELDDKIDLDCFPKMHVLCPPLRQDFLELIKAESNVPAQKPKYILCNVRISPEKNASLFAQIIRALSREGYFKKWNLTPLLVGSVCDTEYNRQVHSCLPSEVEVVDRFISPKELLSYLRQTVLLVHPPVYEAYGMVIAEAAALGVPSIIHKESIGASSMFNKKKGEVLTTDMRSLDKATKSIIDIIENPKMLKKIGKAAQTRAFEWKTTDYGSCLIKNIESDTS